jgi:hypothetical protein
MAGTRGSSQRRTTEAKPLSQAEPQRQNTRPALQCISSSAARAWCFTVGPGLLRTLGLRKTVMQPTAGSSVSHGARISGAFGRGVLSLNTACVGALRRREQVFSQFLVAPLPWPAPVRLRLATPSLAVALLATRPHGFADSLFGGWRPNPSLKPSPNGGPPGHSHRYGVHFLWLRPGVPPSVPA